MYIGLDILGAYLLARHAIPRMSGNCWRRIPDSAVLSTELIVDDELVERRSGINEGTGEVLDCDELRGCTG